jgi:uncharacterized phage protein (TIGR01671 family)
MEGRKRMREIKFRAWDRAEKRMVTDMNSEGLILIPTSPGWGVAQSNEVKGVNEWDDYLFSWTDADIIDGRWEPLQFTGLWDKNGKEIYEGDIIIRPVEPTDWNKKQFHINKLSMEKSLIVWDEENAGFEERFRPGNSMHPFFEIVRLVDVENKIEIIGNIYENTELIKVEVK